MFADSPSGNAEQVAVQAMKGADSILPKDTPAMVAAAAASLNSSPQQAQHDGLPQQAEPSDSPRHAQPDAFPKQSQQDEIPSQQTQIGSSLQDIHKHSPSSECSSHAEKAQQAQQNDGLPEQRQHTELMQQTQLNSSLHQAHHNLLASHALQNCAANPQPQTKASAQGSVQPISLAAEASCDKVSAQTADSEQQARITAAEGLHVKASAQTADSEQQARNTGAEVQLIPTRQHSRSSSAATEACCAVLDPLCRMDTSGDSHTQQLSSEAGLAQHSRGNSDISPESSTWGSRADDEWRFERSQYPQPDSYSWDGTDASSDSGPGVGGVMAALQAFQSMRYIMADEAVVDEQQGAAIGDVIVSDPHSSTVDAAGGIQGSRDHAVGVAQGPTADTLGEPNSASRTQPAMATSGLAVPDASSSTRGQRPSSQIAAATSTLDQCSISHRYAQSGVAWDPGAGRPQTSAAVADIGQVCQHSHIVEEKGKKKRVKRVGVIGEHEVVRRVADNEKHCVVKDINPPSKPRKQGWLERMCCCGSSATK